MNRNEMIARLKVKDVWDCIVIGGGATGLGVAVDAAARGYNVALLEMSDFAKGTSCKSTKLVHGGVRYLQHGDVWLVLEALRERGRMKRNAPHLVTDQAFVIANYSYWANFLYFCGLTFYDMLSFGFGYGRSHFISPEKVMEYLPTAIHKGLKGGVVYHDGQFDDSRMAVNLAQTCAELGGIVVNKAKVTEILHDENGRASGVKFFDAESGEEIMLKARCIVNACGVFVDEVMSMDSPEHKKMVTPSQGVHLVFDKKFHPGNYAVMIPKTSDGRVLFAVPWHDRVVVGTTDIMRPVAESEPLPLKEEIDFILHTAALYFETPPQYADILSVFAGQRPLAAPKSERKSTKELSRGHKIIVSPHQLITITGGKWTSYRRMAEDTVNKAIQLGLLKAKKCRTKNLRIHGYRPYPDLNNHLYVYGSDEAAIRALADSHPDYAKKLHDDYPYTVAEVVWAVRREMARDVEDVLARRVRLLYIDARAAIAAAPVVAEAMAKELDKNRAWVEQQIRDFTNVAKNYIVQFN
jgi:glycerol-3-phosphate dehydrogenase